MAELLMSEIHELEDRCAALRNLMSRTSNQRVLAEYAEDLQDTLTAIKRGYPLPRQTVVPVINPDWTADRNTSRPAQDGSDETKSYLNSTGGCETGKGRSIYIEGTDSGNIPLKQYGLVAIARGLISQNSLPSSDRLN